MRGFSVRADGRTGHTTVWGPRVRRLALTALRLAKRPADAVPDVPPFAVTHSEREHPRAADDVVPEAKTLLVDRLLQHRPSSCRATRTPITRPSSANVHPGSDQDVARHRRIAAVSYGATRSIHKKSRFAATSARIGSTKGSGAYRDRTGDLRLAKLKMAVSTVLVPCRLLRHSRPTNAQT